MEPRSLQENISTLQNFDDTSVHARRDAQWLVKIPQQDSRGTRTSYFRPPKMLYTPFSSCGSCSCRVFQQQSFPSPRAYRYVPAYSAIILLLISLMTPQNNTALYLESLWLQSPFDYGWAQLFAQPIAHHFFVYAGYLKLNYYRRCRRSTFPKSECSSHTVIVHS